MANLDANELKKPPGGRRWPQGGGGHGGGGGGANARREEGVTDVDLTAGDVVLPSVQ